MVTTQPSSDWSLRYSSLALFLLAAVILVAGLVDIPRQLTFGPISLLGGVMLLCTGGPLLCWFFSPRLFRSYLRAFGPLLLFVAWTALTILWSSPGIGGIQNLLAPLAFTVLAYVGFRFCRSVADGWERVGTLLLIATALAGAVYAANLAIAGLGSSALMGARTFALFALLGLGYCLAAWRYGWKAGFYGALLILLLIGLSLSRMALVVGIALLLLARLPLRDPLAWIRLLIATAVLATLSYQLVMNVPPLRARFMEGDTSLQVAGIAINATGRTAMWNAVLASSEGALLTGKGAGSASGVIATRFPGLGQAHCDYLRLLHDFGLIGLGLWILGQLNLLLALFRGWAMADERGDPAAALHLSAILALFSLAMVMATDNPMIYVFVMAPMGVMVGASLGAMRRESI